MFFYYGFMALVLLGGAGASRPAFIKRLYCPKPRNAALRSFIPLS